MVDIKLQDGETLTPEIFKPGDTEGTFVKRRGVMKDGKVVRWLDDEGTYRPALDGEKGDVSFFSPDDFVVHRLVKVT